MPRSWRSKFRYALAGLWLAVRTENSFAVHLPAALAVLVSAALLRVSFAEGCLLGLCVTAVITTELFNTALEHLAKAIDRQHNEHLRFALDIGSSAVLAASLGAAAVGATIFGYRLGVALAWWR